MSAQDQEKNAGGAGVAKKAQERPWWSPGPKLGWSRPISSTEAFIYKAFSPG